MADSAADRPAIPAARNRIGKELIYRLMVLLACWGAFHKVWLKVEGPLPHPADGPMVVYMNHPGWWDGYMAFLLDKAREARLDAVDAGGQTLMARLVPAGETVALTPALPVRLRIGNAQGTALQFRGQPVDLSAAARDNIANITLP